MQEILDKVIKENTILPQGNLRCAINKGSFQYYKGRTYLSKKNMEMIRGLAQREYNEKIIMILDSMIKKIDELIKIYKEEELSQ